MKTIVILGMHRSATSLLARSLHGECYAGSDKWFIPPAPDNPKGFFEDRRIVLFNDVLLHACGSSWDNPKEIDIEYLKKCKLDNGLTTVGFAKNILNDLYREANQKTLVVKDPRMCLLIDFWWPLLENSQIVCSFRDSMEIAKSLNKREGMSIEKGIELTEYYNNEVKRFINKNY